MEVSTEQCTPPSGCFEGFAGEDFVLMPLMVNDFLTIYRAFCFSFFPFLFLNLVFHADFIFSGDIFNRLNAFVSSRFEATVLR